MLRISMLFALFVLFLSVFAIEEDARCNEPLSKCVISTKVFTMKVEPMLFNKDISDEKPDRYSYQPSLLGSPDLPSWMQYIYSKSHHAGFIYGTPPPHQPDFTLEIVAVDDEDYNTTTRIIKFVVLPRKEPARHQVHLKIDNLAVEDLFDSNYLDDLLSVFRSELWPEAIHDLHVTFFASAVHLGARLPLRPEEKEGVVIRVGSAANVSENLHRLQNEVRPLYKLSKLASCPRDFKRTTVDRLFRQLNFEMDWCAFRLTSDIDHSREETNSFPTNIHMHHHHFKPLHLLDLPRWHSPSREEAPERSYVHEFLLSILIPMLVMILLAILLSLILCFHHEGIADGSSEYFDSLFDVCEDLWGNKRNQETPAIQMVRYAAVQRATSTLRSLSTQRDPSPALSRLAPERENIFRPHPPPYSTGTRNSGVDF